MLARLLASVLLLALLTPHTSSRSSSDALNGTSCSEEKRVLITGVSGMIGSHVARELVRRRHQDCFKVFGLVRLRADLSALSGILHSLTLVFGDITDSVRMVDVFTHANPDLVFHFAAQAINGVSFSMAQLTLQTNVMGTLNVLEASKSLAKKPRVLVAGSSTEYGDTAETHSGPIPENVILAPVSPYGISKLVTERLARLYYVSHGVQTVTARLFIHVGVGGTDSLAIHEFCKQIAMAELGIAPPEIRHGNLDTFRDMTDAQDSAGVLIKLAQTGVPGEAYNVGSGTSMKTKALLDIAVAQSQVKNLTLIHEKSRLRVFDEKRLVADIGKLRNLTGWVPNTDMHQTVKNIINYWRGKVRVQYCATSEDGSTPCGSL